MYVCVHVYVFLKRNNISANKKLTILNKIQQKENKNILFFYRKKNDVVVADRYST